MIRTKKRTDTSDLDDEALHDICKDLNIWQLVCLVKKDPRFLHAAQKVFIDRHSNDFILITSESKFSEREDSLSLPAWDFLNNFGSCVKHLCIEYSKKFVQFNRFIESKIAKECAKSLLSIQFINASRYSFSSVSQKFVKVESVRIEGNVSVSVMQNFNRLFPNAVRLRFLKAKVPPETCFNEKFPALQHLGIKNGSSFDDGNEHLAFQSEHLVSIIAMNPQLMSLELDDSNSDGVLDSDNGEIKITQKLLGRIAEMSPNLKVLWLNFPDVDNNEIVLGFSHLERILIECHQDMGPVKIFSSRLKFLSLNVGTLNDNCLQMVLANDSLYRLKLHFLNIELSKKVLHAILEEATKVRQLAIITESSSETLFGEDVGTSFRSLLAKGNHLTKLQFCTPNECHMEQHDNLVRTIAVENGWSIDFQESDDFRGILLKKVA